MFSLFRKLSSLTLLSRNKKFYKSIVNITGLQPGNIDLYKLAISHTSVAKESPDGIRHSNERLEYLGDAMLGAIVAEYLFKKFPYKDEGFLTEIRSRLVNREALNKLAKRIGLNKIVEFSGPKNSFMSHNSIYGDALEALVGAVYLDLGFESTRKFVLKSLIEPNFDLQEIVNNNLNFKSMLIEWAQKENKVIKFTIINEIGSVHQKTFTAQVSFDEIPYSTGTGFSKKKSEQAAAEKACELLGLK
ncbi:MAG TPA: ribonuclease III [Cytophagaceae bacterium]